MSSSRPRCGRYRLEIPVSLAVSALSCHIRADTAVMTTYTIDTVAAVRRPTEASLKDGQAQAFVRIFAASQEQVTTKADLAVLKAHLSLRIYLMAGLVVVAIKILDWLGV